jgi:hypothetical protein
MDADTREELEGLVKFLKGVAHATAGATYGFDMPHPEAYYVGASSAYGNAANWLEELL